jgi:hypothetical protein
MLETVNLPVALGFWRVIVLGRYLLTVIDQELELLQIAARSPAARSHSVRRSRQAITIASLLQSRAPTHAQRSYAWSRTTRRHYGTFPLSR